MLEQAATKSFDQLFDKGLLGVFVVLLMIGLGFAGMVIRFLYNEGRARDTQLVGILERVIALSEGSRAAAASGAAAAEQMRITLDALRRAIEELEHAVEKNSSETRHAVNNNGQGIAGIIDTLRRFVERRDA